MAIGVSHRRTVASVCQWQMAVMGFIMPYYKKWFKNI
jgi:hypothetical protein